MIQLYKSEHNFKFKTLNLRNKYIKFVIAFLGLEQFLARYQKMSMPEMLKVKRQKWSKQVKFEIVKICIFYSVVILTLNDCTLNKNVCLTNSQLFLLSHLCQSVC
jgi:hypothetical protein